MGLNFRKCDKKFLKIFDCPILVRWIWEAYCELFQNCHDQNKKAFVLPPLLFPQSLLEVHLNNMGQSKPKFVFSQI